MLAYARVALVAIAGLLACIPTVVSGMQEAAPEPELVLVAGATGRTGQLVVKELRASGYAVRAFVRDTERATELLGDEIEYAQGDVRDTQSIGRAMTGVHRLVSAIGATRGDPENTPEVVDFGGVRNLAEAARHASLRQIVLVSSAGVTHDEHILNRLFGNVLVWKGRGEQAVRDSKVPYTIIRPGGLTDSGTRTTGLLLRQGDDESGFVSRGDVARVCVAALAEPAALGKTFELFSGDQPVDDDWASIFAGIGTDGSPVVMLKEDESVE